jgi:hypothetical protein
MQVQGEGGCASSPEPRRRPQSPHPPRAPTRHGGRAAGAEPCAARPHQPRPRRGAFVCPHHLPQLARTPTPIRRPPLPKRARPARVASRSGTCRHRARSAAAMQSQLRTRSGAGARPARSRTMICKALVHEGKHMYSGKNVSPPVAGGGGGPLGRGAGGRPRAGRDSRARRAPRAQGGAAAAPPGGSAARAPARPRPPHAWPRPAARRPPPAPRSRGCAARGSGCRGARPVRPRIRAGPASRPRLRRLTAVKPRPRAPQASTSSTSTTSARTSCWTCWSAGRTQRRSSTRATRASSPSPARPWR